MHWPAIPPAGTGTATFVSRVSRDHRSCRPPCRGAYVAAFSSPTFVHRPRGAYRLPRHRLTVDSSWLRSWRRPVDERRVRCMTAPVENLVSPSSPSRGIRLRCVTWGSRSPSLVAVRVRIGRGRRRGSLRAVTPALARAAPVRPEAGRRGKRSFTRWSATSRRSRTGAVLSLPISCSQRGRRSTQLLPGRGMVCLAFYVPTDREALLAGGDVTGSVYTVNLRCCDHALMYAGAVAAFVARAWSHRVGASTATPPGCCR